MDIRKTLSTINIILHVEDQNNISNTIQEIFNYLQNGDPNSLNEQKDALFSILEDSEIGNFTSSDLKILDFLSVRKFFSDELKEEIDRILALNSYEVNDEFQNFINNKMKI